MSVVNWLLIGRVLVVSGSPCSFCCGGRGGERDLGNEVVVKRDGAIMRKNYVPERNGGLIIVKLLDRGKMTNDPL